ncbi:MAG: hypothetical protein V1827_03335 [Candidatus Micrarchaeota archaeon]
MAEQTFGGDDGGGAAKAPEKKKLSLGRFGMSPDANPRDFFWQIMASYAASKKPGTDLSAHGDDRFALMRMALSTLSSPNTDQYGLPSRFVALYSLMMLIDGGWDDALSEFLERSCDRKSGAEDHVSGAVKKLMSQEHYSEALSRLIGQMVRGRETTGAGLELLAKAESAELSRSLKKEIMIIARGDIGQNQLNAIKGLSHIKEDIDAKKSLIILLSHWDAQARLAAAEVLLSMKGDADVAGAAAKRLPGETDEEIKKILKRIR